MPVEGAGEKVDSASFAQRYKRAMIIRRQFQAAQHIVLGFIDRRRCLLVVCLWRAAHGQRGGAERLKFDGIRSGIGRHLDQLAG